MSNRRFNLEHYPSCTSMAIQWNDMDAYQHINNTRYFVYFETARIVYSEQIQFAADPNGQDVIPILAETGCRYRFPLVYPDTIDVYARTLWFDNTEMEMEYLIWSQNKQDAAAIGTARVVCLDHRHAKRGQFPEHVIKALHQFDPGAENRMQQE